MSIGDIDTELGDFLKQFPGIHNLVGDRIYPGGHLPQRKGAITSEMPAITFHDVSDVSHYTQPATVSCYTVFRYQIETWDGSLQGAKRVSGIIKEVLDGYAGSMGPREVGFVERKGYPSEYKPAIDLWHTLADYIIHVMS